MNRIAQTVPVQYDTCYSPFPAAELDTALAFLQAQGFDGVELAVAHPQAVDGAALRRKVDGFGLACTTLSTGQAYGLDGVWLASPDADVRGRAVELIKGHVDLARTLGGCPVTVGLLRGKCQDGDKAAYLENLRLAMEACARYASSRGIMLQLEPINRKETALLNTTQETLDFIGALHTDCVGILYDTYHSYLEDGDMLAAIRAAGGKLTNIHLSDSNRGLPGMGDIPFERVYEAITATGYAGAYALEVLNQPSAEYINRHCARSILSVVKNRQAAQNSNQY